MRRKGNILLVANYASDVGYAWWLMENFWTQISRYFHDQNRLCFLIYPKINRISEKILNAPVIISEHDFSDRSLPSLKRLKKLIKMNKIRSVYITDNKYYSPYYALLRCWGIDKIVLHDHIPGERPSIPIYKRIIKHFIHSIGFFSCDHYIGVSKFVYERFVNTACIPHNKCSYTLNGIIPIETNGQYTYYAHDIFNIPKNSIIIVTTGRATFYKGLDIFIKCSNIIINEKGENDVYFLHCGDGPDLEAFKRMSANFGLNHRLIFAGNRPDVRQILQSCSIGIQASRGEAFSLSILEYMSAGLVVLAPNHCGNPEAIQDNVNGILYKPGDVQDLAERLCSLIHDEDRRARLGSAAKNTVLEKFDIKRTNAELIRILAGEL
jgi:glycosyltransferase involved in cell wall biosynthesis